MYFVSGSAAFARCRHSKISIVEEPSEPVTLVLGRGSLRFREGVWGCRARPRFDRGDPVISETASVPRNRGFSRQVRLWARCSIPRFGGIDARAGACEFWRENGRGHVAQGRRSQRPRGRRVDARAASLTFVGCLRPQAGLCAHARNWDPAPESDR
jgi:hypothetical protein